ncbi:MAG TPA: hypothetical protein VJX67_27890 [Blastocatellia bacterium]|nr:hypothetical protein [Blastocatellia bacterium]
MLSVVAGVLIVLSISILVAHAMDLGLSHAYKNAPGRSQSGREK